MKIGSICFLFFALFLFYECLYGIMTGEVRFWRDPDNNFGRAYTRYYARKTEPVKFWLIVTINFSLSALFCAAAIIGENPTH